MEKKKFFHIGNIVQALEKTVRRFPIGSILALAVCSLIFYQIHDGNGYIILLNTTITAIVCFFLSVGVTLFAESKSWEIKKHFFSQIGVFIFGGLFYISLGYDGFQSFENMLQIFLTLFGFCAFLFSAAFIKDYFGKTYENTSYQSYFLHIFWNILMSGIVGGVLTLGGIIAIGSVHALFDIQNFSYSFYEYWAALSLSFFAPMYFLANIPTHEVQKDLGSHHSFSDFLIRFIAIPFIYLYFIILYLYSIKVLSNFGDWPKGIISWMVIGFSVFGYIIYIFSYHLHEKNILVRYFRNCFPYIVFPQIAMLFYAIYLRIAQYDVTINRYLIVIFGIWLCIISLFFIISRKKPLIFIPTSLIIIISIISIGPWGVFSYPESRQYSQLMKDLSQANIYQNGTIVPLQTGNEISPDMSNQIYDRIRYLCNQEGCETIKTLFDTQIREYYATEKMDFTDGYGKKCSELGGCEYIAKTASNWDVVYAVTETIKVTYYSKQKSVSPLLNFYTEGSHFPLQIGGYDVIGNIYGEQFKSTPQNTNGEQITQEAKNTDNLSVKINILNRTAHIEENNEIVQNIDIGEFLDTLASQEDPTFKQSTPHAYMTYEFEGSPYSGKFLFTYITLINPEAPEALTLDSGYYIGVDGIFLLNK